MIQVPSWSLRTVVAQALITSEKHVSNRTSKPFARSAFRKLFDTCKALVSKTQRGSGDHHKIGWPETYQGKIPSSYAFTSLSTDKSPPTANNPVGSARSGRGNTGR